MKRFDFKKEGFTVCMPRDGNGKMFVIFSTSMVGNKRNNIWIINRKPYGDKIKAFYEDNVGDKFDIGSTRIEYVAKSDSDLVKKFTDKIDEYVKIKNNAKSL